MRTRTRLTIGPLYFLWEEAKWRDFYLRIADEAPVDRVVIGETVCSKRMHFIEPHLAEVIERLISAGKEVVLSTLALVTLDREVQMVRSLAEQDDFVVEANDLSALHLLAGKPHIIGPLVNVYNGATARLLASRGATSICLPPELPARSVTGILTASPDTNFEIFAFGRIPLAISARCAHARAKGHIKDTCKFVCGEEPDGLPVRTLAGQSFLTLNGVQTVSHTCQALVQEIPGLIDAGLAGFRLSPQDCDMVAVAQLYQGVMAGLIEPEQALAELAEIYPDVPFSNGFHHQREGAAWVARARSAALGS
jgi:O2-independent ubiquinone biosynthesis protein UbiV